MIILFLKEEVHFGQSVILNKIYERDIDTK